MLHRGTYFLKTDSVTYIPEGVQTAWIIERSGVYVTVNSSNIFPTSYLVNQNVLFLRPAIAIPTEYSKFDLIVT